MNRQGFALADRQPRHLTPSAAWGYARPVTGVPVIGIGVPDSEADSRWPRVCDYFFVRLHGSVLYGRGCAGSRKARRPSDRYSNPYGSVHLIGVRCGFNRNQRIDVMDIHAPGASAPLQAAKPAIFQFHSTEVRTVDRDGQIWFVASDIAKALNYADAVHLTRVLDEDEAALHNVETRSENGTLQTREVTIISESGLYHALLKSRKPQARPFRRWVTQEVLPAIRRSVGYGGSASARDPLDLKEPIEALHKFWEECADVVKTSGGTVPRWPDIDLRELAMGLVGDYLATRARFLLDFDHIGTPHLQFVPPGASILSATDKISMSTLMREYIPGEMLPDLMRIGLDRLARMAERGRNAPVRANPIDKEVKP